MKEFQDKDVCPKCDKDKLSCEYKHTTELEEEHLSWRCSRCGYVWKTKPKNFESEDDNGSEKRT